MIPLLTGRPAKASLPSGVSKNSDVVSSLIVLLLPVRNSFTMVGDSVDTNDPEIKSGLRSFVPEYAVGHVGEPEDEEFSLVMRKVAL